MERYKRTYDITIDKEGGGLEVEIIIIVILNPKNNIRRDVIDLRKIHNSIIYYHFHDVIVTVNKNVLIFNRYKDSTSLISISSPTDIFLLSYIYPFPGNHNINTLIRLFLIIHLTGTYNVFLVWRILVLLIQLI